MTNSMASDPVAVVASDLAESLSTTYASFHLAGMNTSSSAIAARAWIATMADEDVAALVGEYRKALYQQNSASAYCTLDERQRLTQRVEDAEAAVLALVVARKPSVIDDDAIFRFRFAAAKELHGPLQGWSNNMIKQVLDAALRGEG